MNLNRVKANLFKKPHKYKAKKCEWSGVFQGKQQVIKFDSKAEMKRFCELRLLEKSGAISNLELQKTFELIPKQQGERAVSCRVDFFYEELGKMVVEELKSEMTAKLADYVIKRKLFKWVYPGITHREVIR